MIVAYSDDPRKLETDERILFVRHAHYTMTVELTQAFRQALLLALEQMLAEEWNTQLESAWGMVWDECAAVVFEQTTLIQRYVECITTTWSDAEGLGMQAFAAKLQANLMVEMMNKSTTHKMGNSGYLFGHGLTDNDSAIMNHNPGMSSVVKIVSNMPSVINAVNAKESDYADDYNDISPSKVESDQSKNANYDPSAKNNSIQANRDKTSTSKRALALDVTDLLKLMVNQVTNVEQMTGLTSNLDIPLQQIFKRNGRVPELRRVASVVFSTIREVFKNSWTAEHEAAWQWLWSFAVVAKDFKWTNEMAERVLAGWKTLEVILQIQLDRDLAHTKVPQDYYVENDEDASTTHEQQSTRADNSNKAALNSYSAHQQSENHLFPVKDGGISPKQDKAGNVLFPPLPSGQNELDENTLQMITNNPLANAATVAAGSRNIHAWLFASPLNLNGPKKREFGVEDVTDSSSDEEVTRRRTTNNKNANVKGKIGLHVDSGEAEQKLLIPHDEHMLSGNSGGGGINTRDMAYLAGSTRDEGNGNLKHAKNFDDIHGDNNFNNATNNQTTTGGSSVKRIKKIPQVRVRAKIAYKIGVFFYSEIFKKAPTLRRVFVRPAHNYGILFKKIFSMMIKNVYEPAEMWSDQQSLALRHVNFGMRPSDVPLFGKIFLQALQILGSSAWTPEFHSAWSVFWEIGSFGLNCVVIAGSHPATRALILGDRQELRTALREASREQRVQWACVVELRGQVRSPLEWAIKDGKLKMAELLLREALSLRVDPSNMFYYGANTLWEFHDNLIPFLCDTSPQLLPVLLDGLFWTSSQVLDGHRRVVIFAEHLWGDPRYPSSGASVFETPLAVLASCAQPIMDELFLHPVLDILTEIKWRLFACKSFILDSCVFTVLQFILFVIGFLSFGFIPAIAQFVFRILCWILCIFLAARIVYRAYIQFQRGEVQSILPFGIEIDAIRSLNSQPHKHVDPSLLFKLKKDFKDAGAAAANNNNNADHKGQDGGGMAAAATQSAHLLQQQQQQQSQIGAPSAASATVGPVSARASTAHALRQQQAQRSEASGASNDEDKIRFEDESSSFKQKFSHQGNYSRNKEGNIFARLGVPWVLRDISSWTQITIALLVTIAMFSEFIRTAAAKDTPEMTTSERIRNVDFLASNARSMEWNACVALANLCVWQSLTSLLLLWDPARRSTAVVGVLLSSLTFFLTLIIAFAGAFLRSGVLPSFEGFGAVTATLFFLSQGAFEMELPKSTDSTDSGGGGAIYNTFLEVFAPTFQLVGSLMLNTILMADLTAQCKQVLPVLRGLSNRWLCLQVALEEARLTEAERMFLFDSLPFKFRVVFDDTPSNLTGAISLMMSVTRDGLEFAFDRLERFINDSNTGPDAPWPQQSFEFDAQADFEMVAEKQLKHLMSSANRVQRLLNQQSAILPAAPKPVDKDGNESMARSSVATMVTGLSIPELAFNTL